jgi:hypothetical protein
MKTYPECEKLLAVKDKSQLVGEFLEWASGKNMVLCARPKGDDEEYYPVMQSWEKLLADFFGIDLNKVESERRAMLADLQAKG